LAGSYLFARIQFTGYIMGIMEADFSNQPERRNFSYRDKTSAELVPIVLSPYVDLKVLEEIFTIAMERSDDENKGIVWESNKALMNALNMKLKARRDEQADIAAIAKENLDLATENALNKIIFGDNDSRSEQRLKSALSIFNARHQ